MDDNLFPRTRQSHRRMVQLWAIQGLGLLVICLLSAGLVQLLLVSGYLLVRLGTERRLWRVIHMGTLDDVLDRAEGIRAVEPAQAKAPVGTGALQAVRVKR